MYGLNFSLIFAYFHGLKKKFRIFTVAGSKIFVWKNFWYSIFFFTEIDENFLTFLLSFGLIGIYGIWNLFAVF